MQAFAEYSKLMSKGQYTFDQDLFIKSKFDFSTHLNECCKHSRLRNPILRVRSDGDASAVVFIVSSDHEPLWHASNKKDSL